MCYVRAAPAGSRLPRADDPCAAKHDGLNGEVGAENEVFRFTVGTLGGNGQDNQVRRFALSQASGFVFPTQRPSSVETDTSEEHKRVSIRSQVRRLLIRKARVRQDVEIWIGGKAICTKE